MIMMTIILNMFVCLFAKKSNLTKKVYFDF